MIAVVCVDDHGGTLFNHRRQSQDRALRADLLRAAEGHPLWMSPYSARQFTSEELESITVSDDFLTQAGAGDYCFVEGSPLSSREDTIEELILYKWNRVYPSDTFFDIPLAERGWTLANRSEFPRHPVFEHRGDAAL
jgi:hypothetical protein